MKLERHGSRPPGVTRLTQRGEGVSARPKGCHTDVDQAGERSQPSPASQLPEVDAVVRRPQQTQVTPAVAVGPEFGPAAVGPHEPLGFQVLDESTELLRPPAVLALVSPGEAPVGSDGQAGGERAVDAEDGAGHPHVDLRRGRDDHHMVTLGLVPFEATSRSGAQLAGQVAGGEGGRRRDRPRRRGGHRAGG